MSSAGPMGPSGRSTSDPADLARRGVSVSLRATADSTDPSDAMDPANQSLHEALRITYRLVQLAMVVLGGLFLVSGFQSVNEGEQGIRLLFGKRDPELLQPGFRFSAPFPLGELIRVRTGVEQIDLSTEFWPFLSSEDKAKPITQLYGRESLKPENDGSAITADGGLVHMQWRVRYGRTNPGLFSENLRPEIEERLVRSAVQRGVVQAASQVRVDDLLKQSNDEVGSLASRAREVAQATLDRAGSGIRIERLSLLEKMPPLFLKDKFATVQTAQQKAQQLQEKAVSDAQRRMSETAGGAAATLVALIDEYEASIERGDEPMRESLLARIDVILEGRAEESSLRVAGEVTRVLSEANRYRSAIANERRSDLSSFMAKMEQFASNPLVTVHREWSDALRAFSERETVETMLIPRGTTTLTMVINRDPEIARRIETKIREAEAETSRIERERRQRDARFRTEEGLKSTPGT